MDTIEVRVGRRIRDTMLGEVRESVLAQLHKEPMRWCVLYVRREFATPGEAQAALRWMRECDDPDFLAALTDGKYVDRFLPA